jgi:hypothetical protein
VSDNQRIEDLRRRVEKDPGSIAFAQLAEEYRRAGLCQEAVDVCEAGLATHPGYLSARVTLGRALIELERLDEAQTQLELVLRGASENLAAIRGLAEIHHRRGDLPQALTQYRAALALARNDPDLEQTVDELTRKLSPRGAAPPPDGLTVEQMKRELVAKMPSLHAGPSTPADDAPPAGVPADSSSTAPPPASAGAASSDTATSFTSPPSTPVPAPSLGPSAPTAPPMAATVPATPALADPPDAAPPSVAVPSSAPVPPPAWRTAEQPSALGELEPPPTAPADPERERARVTLAALEGWLTAVHVARADRAS